jgi:hypothetical protein
MKVLRNLFSYDVHKLVKEWISTLDIDLLERDKVFLRSVMHNPSFLIDVHKQLEPFASELFQEPVKKSYCFLSVYDYGGICPLHVDRPQCKWTIDYLVDQTSPIPWPLMVSEWVESPPLVMDDPPSDHRDIIRQHSWDAALLYPNDAAYYSGTNQLHFRNRAPLDTAATLVFFHFVSKDFSDSLS